MKDTEYTYAVARIRSLETTLFTNAVIEQLLACRTEEQCVQLLIEKGWGGPDVGQQAEAILKREEEKVWETLREIAPDLSVFDVLSYPKLYHNLKAAVKAVCTEVTYEHIFYEDCAITGEEMVAIIQEKNFDALPGNMPEAAREACETLLQTRDGQLCDIIIDRAALDAVYEAGQAAKDEIIRSYTESTVAIADIKIAVRAQKTGKPLEFMKRAMADCESIDKDRLAQAVLKGRDALREYLETTSYAEGAAALEESPSAFERWCDNRLIETIKPQKFNSFSAGPLVAYLLARENEIKTVRIILTGKQNGFPEEAIRERIREMYV